MKKIALSLFVIASSGAYVWDQAGKGPIGDVIDTAGPASIDTVGPAGAGEKSMMLPPAPARPVATGSVPASAPPSPGTPQPSVGLKPPATTPPTIDGETTAAIAAPAQEPPMAEKPSFAVAQPRLSQASSSLPEEAPAQRVADAAPPTAAFTITPAVYIPIPQPRPDHPQAPARVIKAAMKLTAGTGTKTAAHGFADGTYTGPVTDAYYGLIQIQASIQGGRLTALKVLKYPSDRRTSININRQALPMLRDEAISAQSADVDIISGATLTSKAFIRSLGGALKKASS
ncbi:FMN-binding protein [Mesorhizobium sp. AR07]|uniref:FMN-binding protein n=1 Tax=Mesorhizobium sp. AR07 TaxID=2865838 RepID=UPI00215FC1A1|nr:FMN-binding protein [Mesorhizobium sp. AR07]UVK42780.1 FMN-binding protein [Mesorhizobium sp. AR07]